MPRISERDFLARHGAQRIDTAEAARDPALAQAGISAADVDNSGQIEGDPELRQVYAKLLGLDASASPQLGLDLDAPSVKPVYNALAARFAQRIGTEPALGARALSSVPELAATAQGVTALSRKANVKQLGVGSVQDALLVCAAAEEARTGAPSLLRVNLGAQNANRGLFGPGTEGAVKELQRQVGIPDTGIVDAATLAALDALLAQARSTSANTGNTGGTGGTGGVGGGTGNTTLKNARFIGDPGLGDVAAGRAVLSAGAQGASVTAVQQALLDMGFNMVVLRNDVGASGVDGDFGDQTRTALVNFQAHAKIAKTGVVDVATLAALDALAPAPGKKSWDAGQPSHAPVAAWSGQPLRVVSVEDEHRTFLFDRSGVCTGIFPNAVGAPGANTHTGLKKITARLDEAAARNTGLQLWNTPRAFGKRIIDLSWASGAKSGEELHGTFDYKNLGKDVSHGCVRHCNEDIITMFDAVAVGDLVAIVTSFDDPMLRR